MATETQRKAVYKYDDKYERVNCRLEKGTKERIQKTGYKSINKFIVAAIQEKLDRETNI